jgi:hypothetical protein
MSEPISDALATLSDRGLRRLLGARTFLRGLEYFRRRAVEDVSVEGAAAGGSVRGNEAVPFRVKVELSPDGIQSQCNCPVFAKSGQHCKHVAALLICVRDKARAKLRAEGGLPEARPAGNGSSGGGGPNDAPRAFSAPAEPRPYRPPYEGAPRPTPLPQAPQFGAPQQRPPMGGPPMLAAR